MMIHDDDALEWAAGPRRPWSEPGFTSEKLGTSGVCYGMFLRNKQSGYTQ